jgi:hypothetical protein
MNPCQGYPGCDYFGTHDPRCWRYVAPSNGPVETDEVGNTHTRSNGKEYVVGTLVVTHKDGESTRYPNIREDSIVYDDGVLSVEAASGFATHHILDARSYTFDFS